MDHGTNTLSKDDCKNELLDRGHTILTSRELTSRNVCDNRNERGMLAREIT